MWKVSVGFLVGVLVGLVPWVRSPSFAYQAIRSGSPLRLEAYLVLGGDPNAKTPSGTLLFSVIDIGTGPHPALEQMDMLLRHGADPNDGRGADTPLIQAARWCWSEAVKHLLRAGADRRSRGAGGNTAAQDALLTGPQDAECHETQRLLATT
jgi:hypothetical protein